MKNGGGNPDDDGNGGDSERDDDSKNSFAEKGKKPYNPLSLENTMKRKQDNDAIPWLENKVIWKEYNQQMVTYARLQFYDDFIDESIEPKELYKDDDMWKSFEVRSQRLFAAFTMSMQESIVGRNLIDKYSAKGNARGLYFDLDKHYTTNLIKNNCKQEPSRKIRE